MTTRFSRTTFAMAGALALGLGAAAPAALLPQASAFVIHKPTSTPPPPSVIDATKTGSLTIHKRLGAQAGEGTGNALTPAPGTPLPGAPLKDVEFTVQKVQADLTTETGFAEASKLTPKTAVADPESPAQVITTGPDGDAALTGLSLGVYLVTEKEPAAGAVGEKVLIPAKPFLVFLPMTNPENRTEWNYDVHVYPKNTNVTIEKKVEDAGKHSGDKLKWTLDATVPAPLAEFVEAPPEGEGAPEGEAPAPTTQRQVKPLTEYEIVDQLPTNRVDVTDPDVNVTLPQGMVKGTDYQVTFGPGVDADHTELKVTFLAPGLKKLAEEYGKYDNPTIVRLTIDGLIKPTELTGDGITINKEATVTANNGEGKKAAVALSNTVETRHRPVVISKQDEATKAGLAGAEFDLYVCTAPNKLGEKVTLHNGPTPRGPLVTDADGTLTLDALHVTDFVNNNAVTTPKNYCLVETKAPEGYELLTKPVMFVLPSATDGTPAGGATEGEATEGEPTEGESSGTPATPFVLELTVANIKSTSPNLPLTGGPGIIALVLAGLALIGGGAWYGLRSTRKS